MWTCYTLTEDSHNTGYFIPYSFRIVCGFFNVPFSSYKHERYLWDRTYGLVFIPEDLKSLTICWCNYEGSTFYSVVLIPCVTVRPESNSRPPAWQPHAQPTEPPVQSFQRRGQDITGKKTRPAKRKSVKSRRRHFWATTKRDETRGMESKKTPKRSREDTTCSTRNHGRPTRRGKSRKKSAARNWKIGSTERMQRFIPRDGLLPGKKYKQEDRGQARERSHEDRDL